MISTSTVLILGAGASMPYGFPSGRDLVTQITQISSRNTPARYSILRELSFSEEQIRDFANQVARSGNSSIDAFLEHRPELMEIGKAAIATCLVEHEDDKSLFAKATGDSDRWYDYLWNAMRTSFESIGNNRISFVTYNYDRSLEHYLFNAIQNSFGVTSIEAARQLERICIVHLHGKLGSYPLLSKLGDDSRQYGNIGSLDEIRIASRGIKIIHEVDPSHEFELARELIDNAKQVAFLGFGYHERNVERLKLTPSPSGKKYSGTCYGFTDSEVTTLTNAFSGHATFLPKDITNFLRSGCVTLHDTPRFL